MGGPWGYKRAFLRPRPKRKGKRNPPSLPTAGKASRFLPAWGDEEAFSFSCAKGKEPRDDKRGKRGVNLPRKSRERDVESDVLAEEMESWASTNRKGRECRGHRNLRLRVKSIPRTLGKGKSGRREKKVSDLGFPY